MTHYSGRIQGRSHAQRGGTKKTGLAVEAQTWRAAVRVHWLNDGGVDKCIIALAAKGGEENLDTHVLATFTEAELLAKVANRKVLA